MGKREVDQEELNTVRQAQSTQVPWEVASETWQLPRARTRPLELWGGGGGWWGGGDKVPTFRPWAASPIRQAQGDGTGNKGFMGFSQHI